MELKESDVNKPTINIGGDIYYIKPIDKYTEGIEIVVEKLANLVGIKCAHYGKTIINGKPYYLCKEIPNFVKPEIFTGYNCEKLQDILEYINNNYKEQSIKLIDQIIKVFLFDIIILNGDRHINNWGFTEEKDDINVCILDNAYAFYGTDKVKINFEEKDDQEYKNPVKTDSKVIDANMKELNYLLETSSKGYFEMFVEMYEILNPYTVFKIFNSVEEDYEVTIPSKDKLIAQYSKNYIAITNLLNEKNLDSAKTV